MGENKTQQSSETKIHVECFLWFHNNFHAHRQMLLHVDNNSANKVEGNRKKAMGVVKGVSDFILILDSRIMFIELKTETGRQKPEQLEFMEKVLDRHHQYIIIRSFEQFKQLICQVIGK